MPSRPSSSTNSSPSPDRVARGEQARTRGASGEDIAVAYLTSRGAHILHRNWRPKGAGIRGECDIVAQCRDIICFVEVKTRKSSDFGEPQEAVDVSKRRQLERLARAWIALHGDEQTLRFDIIEIWWGENKNPRVAWIEGAFEVRI
ncbi:YraN family protein [bacterium]|nr:MAG: YraN family protein [bacterium]